MVLPLLFLLLALDGCIASNASLPLISVHYSYSAIAPYAFEVTLNSQFDPDNETRHVLYSKNGGWCDYAILSHSDDQLIFAEGNSLTAVNLYTLSVADGQPGPARRLTQNPSASYSENYASYSPDDSFVLVGFSSSVYISAHRCVCRNHEVSEYKIK